MNEATAAIVVIPGCLAPRVQQVPQVCLARLDHLAQKDQLVQRVRR